MQWTNAQLYSLATTLKHLAYLGRQVPCVLTPAELPCVLTPAELLWWGGTLIVSNIGATGAGEGAMPGGDVAIVALGRARWVWDIERGEGKVRWALAGRWIIALSRGLSLLRLWRHGAGTLSSRNG